MIVITHFCSSFALPHSGLSALSSLSFPPPSSSISTASSNLAQQEPLTIDDPDQDDGDSQPKERDASRVLPLFMQPIHAMNDQRLLEAAERVSSHETGRVGAAAAVSAPTLSRAVCFRISCRPHFCLYSSVFYRLFISQFSQFFVCSQCLFCWSCS